MMRHSAAQMLERAKAVVARLEASMALLDAQATGLQTTVRVFRCSSE
jgi:hypothetical protein